jgi:predicted RecB family nuclease
MHFAGETIELSASDLVGHLNCAHLTSLDLAVARGSLAKPARWDPVLELLRERGARHEQAYVDHLRSLGLGVTVIEGAGVEDHAVGATLAAMKRGDQVIVQGALKADRFGGRLDVLRRTETPSQLGAWSYEVIDTKLARETKGGTILQLCLYSELVRRSQGREPELMYVVAPWSGFEPQVFRTADYAAYFRHVRAALEASVGEGQGETYPEPNPHCDVCRWDATCDAKRRTDDHLSLVAGISKLQIGELASRGIATVTALAAMPLPLEWKPERGSKESLERVREQARIQCEGRAAGCILYEMLPVVPTFGLCRLPEPSPGDIFLDLEGDPFVGEAGLEFLVGYAWANDEGEPCYTADWSRSRADERAAFERFIDFAMARLEKYPDLHIYHYAPYEPAALKRLMGRYATREDELDGLLRSAKFVDLFAVVRHAVRASVESYSIKKLEPLYGYVRTVPLTDVNRSLARVQACLELDDPEGVTAEDRAAVQGYNQDDCVSTWRLRDWLETLRAQQITAGEVIERPTVSEGETPENVTAWLAKIEPVIAALLAGSPDDPAERTAEQQAKWLLANMIDWHRRELKASWWEHFRLAALSPEDLLDERAGLSGLTFETSVGGTAKCPIHRYRFPQQETQFRGEESLKNVGGKSLGSVEDISIDERWVDIKKSADSADVHPQAVYAHSVVTAPKQADALFRLGAYVVENGMEGPGLLEAARGLILRMAPRTGGAPLQLAEETASQAAIRLAPLLEGGTLGVQGPPGAGKTYTGARMICALAAAGKRVGICATSHKVIRNLLDATIEAAKKQRQAIQCVQRPKEMEDDRSSLRFAKKESAFFSALATDCQVGGATAWVWAREEARNTVDVLFVDEAAQMSLANILAISQAARVLVMLGDPQQLDQPIQGSHPEGTDVSGLTHMLDGEQTIAPGRGLFLDLTWRLHPDICRFTSEVFYENRLQSRPGLEIQRVNSSSRVQGSGLRCLLVRHTGNQSSSAEEAEAVRALVHEILAAKSKWVDNDGEERDVTLKYILIIAPYNAQVFQLKDVLPAGAEVGTVDKFQGQQAAIVIYSMTTSSHADAPRGMEFLYSLNRLNVATSRAKCVCVLVAAPDVFEPECRTPRQMRLANALCRYLELATSI